MPAELPDFDKAEYRGDSVRSASTYRIDDPDLRGHAVDAQSADHARFVQALLYGTIAAIVGSIVYAGFTLATHIEIGYLAVGVGYLVGKAMLHATGGLGGRKYQVASALLTYFSVSTAGVLEILWSVRSRGVNIAHLSPQTYALLAQYAVASPFLRLRGSLGSGLIGLFILFIGIRAAWSFTADRRATAV